MTKPIEDSVKLERCNHSYPCEAKAESFDSEELSKKENIDLHDMINSHSCASLALSKAIENIIRKFRGT